MSALSELVLLALSLGALSSFKEPADLEATPGSTEQGSVVFRGMECPEPGARFRLPGGECGQYVSCVGMQPSLRSCPPGMAFDARYSHCRIAYEVDCDRHDPAPVSCGPNEVYTACGSPCERTCADFFQKQACGYGCREMCQCRLGYVREHVGGRCVKPRACPDLNSLRSLLPEELH